jgi:mRNA-degrading endonuclease RelE of RelBE toxin-antitoxin system
VAYRIAFAESVQAHFRILTARERATILDSIDHQLLHEPLKETRHRKPLRPNPIAPWELRIGQLRVFLRGRRRGRRRCPGPRGRAEGAQHTDNR